jgi:hypothetical protein
MACQETMEARLGEEEPVSEDMTPEVAHGQEVPLEDAVVMPVGEPRKRCRDRHLAAQRRQKEGEPDLDARRHGKQQDLVAARRGTTRRAAVARRRILLTNDTTQEYCGSRKRLVAAHRGTTLCAEMARCKKTLVRKIRIGNDVGGGALRERTSGKRRRVDPEGNTGLDNPGARWQLRLRNEKTAGRISWKTHEKTRLEIARQIAGSPVGLHNIEHWTLRRGRPSMKRKK